MADYTVLIRTPIYAIEDDDSLRENGHVEAGKVLTDLTDKTFVSVSETTVYLLFASALACIRRDAVQRNAPIVPPTPIPSPSPLILDPLYFNIGDPIPVFKTAGDRTSSIGELLSDPEQIYPIEFVIGSAKLAGGHLWYQIKSYFDDRLRGAWVGYGDVAGGRGRMTFKRGGG